MSSGMGCLHGSLGLSWAPALPPSGGWLCVIPHVTQSVWCYWYSIIVLVGVCLEAGH